MIRSTACLAINYRVHLHRCQGKNSSVGLGCILSNGPSMLGLGQARATVCCCLSIIHPPKRRQALLYVTDNVFPRVLILYDIVPVVQGRTYQAGILSDKKGIESKCRVDTLSPGSDETNESNRICCHDHHVAEYCMDDHTTPFN